MLQEVFLQRVSDLQSANKRERRYFLTILETVVSWFWKKIDVGFEAISWPHFDGEEVVATPLDFLASSILCEEGLSDLCEVVERAGW